MNYIILSTSSDGDSSYRPHSQQREGLVDTLLDHDFNVSLSETAEIALKYKSADGK